MGESILRVLPRRKYEKPPVKGAFFMKLRVNGHTKGARIEKIGEGWRVDGRKQEPGPPQKMADLDGTQ